MSGHSKWATTKHKKAIIDSRRAKNFAKLIKAIEVASRNGGPDIDGNPTLFDAIAKAKKNSMPADNIDRAVKRGAGLESGGADWQTIMYEGYGPNGVAIMIECLTDSRNRAASEVRVAVTRNGGSMADPGSVAYLFNRKGVIIVNKNGQLTEDSVLEAVLDAGAEEVNEGLSAHAGRWVGAVQPPVRHTSCLRGLAPLRDHCGGVHSQVLTRKPAERLKFSGDRLIDATAGD